MLDKEEQLKVDPEGKHVGEPGLSSMIYEPETAFIKLATDVVLVGTAVAPRAGATESEVLFRLCATTDPQRDSIFTKGPADVLDHATSEIAIGTKLGIDATRTLAGERFKRPLGERVDEAQPVRGRDRDGHTESTV